ncbi:MAG: hypothetical protein NUW22_12505 [Acidobacteria bacterium]|nr:hypothetical protein [Acidobacteriota bacterium]
MVLVRRCANPACRDIHAEAGRLCPGCRYLRRQTVAVVAVAIVLLILQAIR